MCHQRRMPRSQLVGSYGPPSMAATCQQETHALQPTAFLFDHLVGKPNYSPVWNPLDLKCGAASGPDRKSINAFAASAACVSAPTPPVNKVRLPSSPGNGPTNC